MYKGNTTVKLNAVKKSKFDLSHRKRLTTRMGRLTPILVQEAIPGDSFRGSSEVLLRLAPLLAPIYDDITCYVHYFFVPNRLLWSEWEDFITAGQFGPGVSAEPIPPNINLEWALTENVFNVESGISDYLGLPTTWPGIASDYSGLTIDALPFIAYQRCWYDWYRDRNYVNDDVLTFPVSSGTMSDPNAVNFTTIRTRDYMKDYFTAALPFTQRGIEVLMPLAGTGSVTYLDTSRVVDTSGDNPYDLTVDASDNLQAVGFGFAGDARIENIDQVQLTASSVSINDFRSAYALQVWCERNAIGGSRYVESIYAHFQVPVQDSRLQNAEFLGGGRIKVRISEVVNTAFSDNGTDIVPAGNMAGHGVSYGDTNQFKYFAPEHGFIIGIMSIMAPATYQQGISKMFRRRSFLDYPWPAFANLGEQQVDKAEIYAAPENLNEDSDGNLPLFGYQSRYAEWKQMQNSNHGNFRSSLLFWSLTRTFSSTPTLGSTFLAFPDDVSDQIFAVNDGSDNFWCYIANSVTVVRALPYYGQPSIIK